MPSIKLMLISPDGRRFAVKEYADLHTNFGLVKGEDIRNAKPGQLLKSNTGKPFAVIKPGFIDLFSKMRRSAQIMSPKDIGLIIAFTGLNSKSLVVDAGSGSGALCCALANIAKRVVTYDLRDDFIELVKKNIELLGLKNIEVKRGDICSVVEEKNQDLLCLDIPEPWNALGTAKACLKVGGFLVSYSPCISQSAAISDAIEASPSLMLLRTVELIERLWELKGRKQRPMSSGLMHTGFITFARRIYT
ncbi:hypothetical protein COT48_01495 [Candidatus Woesearchaeota archaeon CG08_land_8_20_14_0_20_47_9]|nr:MAG: hypothetical protein COT48_01495 [Candidatus Woesearchaeota archaeon CG08_land_8_20_14_0_20_47_9]